MVIIKNNPLLENHILLTLNLKYNHSTYHIHTDQINGWKGTLEQTNRTKSNGSS